MKYVVVLGDGMADEPLSRLNGKTPLSYAKTPALDVLSKKSEIGMVSTIPEGMKPGSDTANLSVIGYDPRKYYSGRSPLEALSIGVGGSLITAPEKSVRRTAVFSCMRLWKRWIRIPISFMWEPATATA